jgi:hypothetical protein
MVWTDQTVRGAVHMHTSAQCTNTIEGNDSWEPSSMINISILPRQSTTAIEVDAMAENITNLNEMTAMNATFTTNDTTVKVKLIDSLRAMWEVRKISHF